MKPITPFPISAPGFFGLNLQDSAVDLSPNFALQANNCIIDKSGRIASRMGWAKQHSANTDISTSNITCIGELVTTAGVATTLCAGGAFLFKHSGTTLTTLTYGGGGTAPTISASNWQFCQLNNVAMFWQRGYDTLIYDPAVSTTTFRRLSERSGAVGTFNQCNTAISAYGRVWSADTSSNNNTVYFSDVIAPHVMTGGTSGSLDVSKIWPKGGDEIVALASHNNFLIIFGRKQILIYSGADDPFTMKLTDSVGGIGCIARDTVQTTGDDVIFLSDIGVMSLMRTIQEKSAPLRSISKNILNEIQEHVSSETLTSIKSVYSAVKGFYLITFPTFNQTYYFDTARPLDDGSLRSTIWTGVTYKAFCETKSRKLYLGTAGYLGLYSGYLDDVSTYRMTYYTTWIDFGNPIQTSILKKVRLTVVGGANQSIAFKWAYDYQQNYKSSTAVITGMGTLAEYGISEYGIAEYSGNSSVSTVSVNGSSCGQVLQFGFEAEVNGQQFSVQKIDLFTKDGRI